MLRSIRTSLDQRGDEGASAVEYGLLIAAIAAVIILIIFALGGVIQNIFEKTCSSVKAGASVSSTC